MGELKPENIKAVLKYRDTAAKTPCGHAQCSYSCQAGLPKRPP